MTMPSSDGFPPVPPRSARPLHPPRKSQMLSLRRDIRIIRGCLITLTAFAVIAAGIAGAALLAPAAIAVVLALVLAPIAHRMERWGIPAGLAAVLTVAGISFVVGTGALALAPSFSQWMGRAPQMVQSVERKLRPFKQRLAAVESASNRIAQVTGGPRTTNVVVSNTATGGLLSSALRTAPDILAKAVFVIILMIFLLAYRKYYAEQFILMPRSFRNRVRLARIVRDVRHRVSGYLFTLTLINIGLAIITTACFWWAGLSDPMLWGIAFGLFNFIPVLGPTGVIISAAIMGFATANTIAAALIPPAILVALNTVEANLVQPWLLSRRIIIGPIAIFVTVATLVWMWGPAASITAVPILILFHTIAQHVPSLRPIAVLLATENGHGNGHESDANKKHRIWKSRRRHSDLETAVPLGDKTI